MADTETTEVEDTGDSSLSDLFDDSTTEVEQETDQPTETEDKGETEEVKAEESDEETKAETAEEAEPPTAEHQGLTAALLAERDKRQKAEARLKELESKPEPTPDPIEDPEGYAEYIDGKSSTNALRTKIELSKAVMESVEPEYERLEKVFMGLVVDDEGEVMDQGLLTKFQQSPNPAKFAIDHAKQHEQIQKLSDPKYQEKLEADLRAKILAELTAEAKGLSAVDVPDLTTASAQSNSDRPEKLTSIEELFND